MRKSSGICALVLGASGVLAACASNNPPPPSAPQAVVPGSEAPAGLTEQQTVADDEVVNRIANAHCDRSQSCNRVGPGAHYANRDVCLNEIRGVIRKELNAVRCPGGIGERGLAQCVQSLENGQCDSPGQDVGTTSHCKLNSLCID